MTHDISAAAQHRLLSINNYYYRRGGAEVLFLEHNRTFAENGWQVVPFSMRHPQNLPTPWSEYFVDEIEFGRSYGLIDKAKRAAKIIYSREAQQNIRRLLDKAPPQIAHAHNVYHHISPAIFPVLKEAGVPVLMTVHDLKLACPAYTMLTDGKVCERCRGGRIHNVVAHRCIKGELALSGVVMVETLVHRALRLYSKSVDRFVVPSRFYIEKLVEWGWPRDRFVHIPNFVDVERLKPSSDIGEGFLYFGRLSPEKGLTTLIRAAAAAGVRVDLAGSGAQQGELEQLAKSLGADVRFLGYLDEAALGHAIAASRALVLASSWYENAPMSILEGYGLGRPVIGARIGGIPELIRPGETGATFEAGDVDGLARELSRFAAMPAAAVAKMGAAGRAWVEAEFSRTAYRNRMLGLYSQMMVRT